MEEERYSKEPLCNNGALYVLLYEFERAMRRFILYIAEEKLREVYHSNWENEFYNKISPHLLKDIMKACQHEKDIAIYTGMNIDYAKEDFLPFSFISEAADAWWDTLYRDYFKHQQYFKTDIDKIKNVRNAISHFRDTTPGSQMDAFAICKRLLTIVYNNMPIGTYNSISNIETMFQEPDHATKTEDDGIYHEVLKVYPTRNEMQEYMHKLISSAKRIDAMGISINELTSKMDDRSYTNLLKNGTTINLLMLDPEGKNVHIREEEEGVKHDQIANVTRQNLSRMERLKEDLEMDELGHLYNQISITLYDEIPRCNLIFADDILFVQYYAGYVKGENNPTLCVQKKFDDGIYSFYRKIFTRTMKRCQNNDNCGNPNEIKC